jgi:dipeptidyl aminopeptidase/acylaminoacyl peptidase
MHHSKFAFIGLVLILAGCFSASNDTPALDTVPVIVETDPPGGPQSAAEIAAPVPLHELSIETLRARDFPGSDFVFEQTLDSGFNYNRYIVSYLSDSLKIYAMLTIPQIEKPPTGYPVVIFNHGYIPPDQYRTTERYVAYVDAFARNGYIVVKSDYRGHGSSEGNAESAYGSAGYVIDVLNALASARRYPDADPNRVGMWGHSMGGYITLRAMVADQNIKAGVIWAGVVASYTDMFQSWFGRGGGSRSGWRSQMIEQYGTPTDNPAFWNSLSANSYLADLSGPIQIHHGTGDTTVPYIYSTTLEEQIRAAGEPVEMFLWQNDDHNIATNRDNALIVSVSFFNNHVIGE